MDSLARFSDAALDARIDRLIDPIGWIFRHVLNLEPDAWQLAVGRDPSRFRALLKGRQLGGSELAVATVIETLMAGKLAVVVSPSERQSLLLVRRVRRALNDYVTRNSHEAAAFRPINNHAASVLLSNGGEVVGLPGRNSAAIRGYPSVATLIVDEAGFLAGSSVGSDGADELLAAALPMLVASGGRALAVSSPGLVGSWLHRVFHPDGPDGVPGWSTYVVTMADVERFDPEAVAELRQMLGEAAAVELDCEWRSPDGESFLFTATEISRALYGVDAAGEDDRPGEQPLPATDDRPRASVWFPGQQPKTDADATRSRVPIIRAAPPASPRTQQIPERVNAQVEPEPAATFAPKPNPLSAIASMADLLAGDEDDDEFKPWTPLPSRNRLVI